MHKQIPRSRPGQEWPVPWVRKGIGAALAGACLLFAACHKAPPAGGEAPTAAETKPAAKGDKGGSSAKGDAEGKDAQEGVKLTSEQVEKLGVETQEAKATEHSDEAAGFGVVVSHDTIAQAAAELATAQATARLSSSSLSRTKKLQGTPGALSADVEETAKQKAEVDAAALTLTNQRLSSTLGMNPPWKSSEQDAILRDIASGKIKLVRVTFPLGALSGGTPASLRAAHIGAGKPGTGWKMNVVWDAPADATVPGRSFFALLKGSDAGEGERLQVWAPVGEAESGVVVPAAAVVMSEAKYWCYVEKEPGTFERAAVNTAKPTADGYFVTEGVSAGDKIVTTAAGQLLAKESASGAEPD